MSTRGYLGALRVGGSILATIIAAPGAIIVAVVLLGVALRYGIDTAIVSLTVIIAVTLASLVAAPRITKAVMRAQIVWARLVWTTTSRLIEAAAARAEERNFRTAVLDASNKKGEPS